MVKHLRNNVVLNLSHHAIIRVVCACEKIVYWSSRNSGVIIQFGGFKGKCTGNTPNFVLGKMSLRVCDRWMINCVVDNRKLVSYPK